MSIRWYSDLSIAQSLRRLVFVGVVVAMSLIVNCVSSTAVYADGWIGTGKASGGGGGGGKYEGDTKGCTDYYANIGLLECAGVSWIFYKAINTTYSSTRFWINPDIVSTQKIILDIPAVCSQHEGSGFWHYGRNTFGMPYNNEFGKGDVYGHSDTYNWDYQPWADTRALHEYKYNPGIASRLNQQIGPYRATKYGTVADVLKAFRQAHYATYGTEYTGNSLPGNVTSFCWWNDMDTTWEANGVSRISLNQNDWKTGDNALVGVRPGQTVYWNHTVSETRNEKKTGQVNVKAEHQNGVIDGGRDWTFSSRLGDRYTDGLSRTVAGNKGEKFYDENSSYAITQADVGQRVCERITWTPKTGNSNSTGIASKACAVVPYHYPPDNPDNPDDPGGGPDRPGSLPSGGVNIVTTHDGADTVLPGEDVKFNYTIENQKGPTKTKPIGYHAYTFILPSSNDLPTNWERMVTYGMGWNNVDCTNGARDIYGRANCAQSVYGVTGNIYPQDSWTDSSLYNISGDWLGNPGDQICSYVTTDNNWSVKENVSSTSYAASNISCVRIGKRPQIQMNGSDSYAGKGFYSSAYSAIDLNINRGSYGQYGLLTGPSAPITNFGSAGYTPNASAKTNVCKLAFANVGSLTASCSGMAGLGNAGIDHAIAATATIPNGVNANSINAGSIGINGLSNGYHRRSGSLTINGGSLGSGVRATIVVNGDVTITGNIGDGSSESTSYSSLTQVPSLTIIATGNIKVNGSVTLINANLVSTGGKFISCAESSAGNGTDDNLGIRDGAMCKNKLKINGSVVSRQSPVLHRTFGSGNDGRVNQWDNNTITATSEWFNYTPNVWLTPYLSGGRGTPDGYNTVNVTGLPVRY